jgi:phosphopantetheinyl transferase (holo-ACP synthase)
MPEERVTGIGVDIVDIPRMDRALKRWGERFIARVFTAAEVDYSGAGCAT